MSTDGVKTVNVLLGSRIDMIGEAPTVCCHLIFNQHVLEVGLGSSAFSTGEGISG